VSPHRPQKPCAGAYPARALLARFHDYGVPITTASDGHHLDDVSWRVSDLTVMARAAGYSEVRAFRARDRKPLPL
jgi:histidinol phosphatase-like PHP family hydrolase